MRFIFFVLGLSGYCFLGYAICVLSVTIWRGKRPSFERRLIKRLESFRKVKNNGRTHQVAIANLLAMGCAWLLFAVRFSKE